mmetsp:Transcript_41373/g.133048  ORF Transcript_41373/g.133048 Transcript_41373/m.133048 type:complete len:181 (-) Transcript_41373:147-689(-)
MNCEDVAMQFLVANVSGRPPLFVRSSLGDLGVVGGISTRGGHMVERSDCLNDIHALFAGSDAAVVTERAKREVPLVASHLVVGRAGSWLSNQPATWYEFLASDLPIPIPAQIVLALLLAAALLRLVYECCCGSLRLGPPRKASSSAAASWMPVRQSSPEEWCSDPASLLPASGAVRLHVS